MSRRKDQYKCPWCPTLFSAKHGWTVEELWSMHARNSHAVRYRAEPDAEPELWREGEKRVKRSPDEGPGLFDEPAREVRKLHRPDDPEPSKQGARSAVLRLSDLHRRVLTFVTESPGLTSNELEEKYRTGPRVVGRRLNELEAAGKIERRGPRTCRVSGHAAATWYKVSKF